MLRQTDRFQARADDGREYAIVEYTNFLQAGGTGGPTQVAGVRSYKTVDGTIVSGKDDGSFEIFPRGPIVRRV
jgi:hypothetical protein